MTGNYEARQTALEALGQARKSPQMTYSRAAIEDKKNSPFLWFANEVSTHRGIAERFAETAFIARLIAVAQ